MYFVYARTHPDAVVVHFIGVFLTRRDIHKAYRATGRGLIWYVAHETDSFTLKGTTVHL